MFKNLYYHKKTGVIFTVFFLIFIPIYNLLAEGSFYFVFSLTLFIVLYVIPINIIVIFQKISKKRNLKQKEHEEKLKFYEENLGQKLLDEFNTCKTDADYKLWEKRNFKYFETVRDFVIQELEKKEKNLLIEINKIDTKVDVLIASVSEKKSLVKDLLKRHPFLKAIINRQNFQAKTMPSLPNKLKSRGKK
jgi:hypothetical protein